MKLRRVVFFCFILFTCLVYKIKHLNKPYEGIEQEISKTINLEKKYRILKYKYCYNDTFERLGDNLRAHFWLEVIN